VLFPGPLTTMCTDVAGTRLRGSIPLRDILSVKPTDDPGHFFSLTTRMGKDYLIQATSDDDMREWMDAIMRAHLAPTHIARLLHRTEVAMKDGTMSADEKGKLDEKLLSGDPIVVESVEARLIDLMGPGAF
jgi:hypothetical protein